MPLFQRIGDTALTVFWFLLITLAIFRIIERIATLIRIKKSLEINDREW